MSASSAARASGTVKGATLVRALAIGSPPWPPERHPRLEADDHVRAVAVAAGAVLNAPQPQERDGPPAVDYPAQRRGPGGDVLHLEPDSQPSAAHELQLERGAARDTATIEVPAAPGLPIVELQPPDI